MQDAKKFLINNFEYDANDNVEYKGEAEPGTANSDPGWFITKFTYSGKNVTSTRIATVGNPNGNVWTGYAGFTYS